MVRTPVPAANPRRTSARQSTVPGYSHGKSSFKNDSNKENKHASFSMQIDDDDLISGRVRPKGSLLKATNKPPRSSTALADKTNTSSSKLKTPVLRRLIKSPQKSQVPRSTPNNRRESKLRYQIDQNQETGEGSASEESEEDEGKMEVTLVGEASRRKSLKSNVKTGRVTERKTKNGKEITKYRDTAEGSDDDRDSDTDSSSELPGSQETEVEEEDDDPFIRKIATPEELQEQLRQRNATLGEAQQQQIQEITEYLGPLCKSIQKLYAKNQKETQSKMSQCDLYVQSTRNELDGLINVIDAFCAEVSKSDKELKVIQGDLKEAVDKKRYVLQQGHRKLKKLEARQTKEMQEDKKQFEELFATYKAKLTKIEDPAKRQAYLKEKEAHYFMLCDN